MSKKRGKGVNHARMLAIRKRAWAILKGKGACFSNCPSNRELAAGLKEAGYAPDKHELGVRAYLLHLYENGLIETKSKARDFYSSNRWLRLRYRALAEHGARCILCGATPEDGAQMHVDHIKPRSTHPDLAYEFDNLQVLCRDCNFGKSNRDTRDFR